MPTHPIVPQSVVAVGNVIADVFTANAVPPPVIVNAITCLAYDPPETSVPPAESEGAAVNNPTYQFVGFVYEVDPKT